MTNHTFQAIFAGWRQRRFKQEFLLRNLMFGHLLAHYLKYSAMEPLLFRVNILKNIFLAVRYTGHD